MLRAGEEKLARGNARFVVLLSVPMCSPTLHKKSSGTYSCIWNLFTACSRSSLFLFLSFFAAVKGKSEEGGAKLWSSIRFRISNCEGGMQREWKYPLPELNNLPRLELIYWDFFPRLDGDGLEALSFVRKLHTVDGRMVMVACERLILHFLKFSNLICLNVVRNLCVYLSVKRIKSI